MKTFSRTKLCVSLLRYTSTSISNSTVSMFGSLWLLTVVGDLRYPPGPPPREGTGVFLGLGGPESEDRNSR